MIDELAFPFTDDALFHLGKRLAECYQAEPEIEYMESIKAYYRDFNASIKNYDPRFDELNIAIGKNAFNKWKSNVDAMANVHDPDIDFKSFPVLAATWKAFEDSIKITENLFYSSQHDPKSKGRANGIAKESKRKSADRQLKGKIFCRIIGDADTEELILERAEIQLDGEIERHKILFYANKKKSQANAAKELFMKAIAENGRYSMQDVVDVMEKLNLSATYDNVNKVKQKMDYIICAATHMAKKGRDKPKAFLENPALYKAGSSVDYYNVNSEKATKKKNTVFSTQLEIICDEADKVSV